MKEKLVRNKMGEMYPADQYRFVDAKSPEYFSILLGKLEEELNELKDSNYSDVFEFVDVLTVLYSIAKSKGLTKKDIEKAYRQKLKERGDFSDGRVWIIQDTHEIICRGSISEASEWCRRNLGKKSFTGKVDHYTPWTTFIKTELDGEICEINNQNYNIDMKHVVTFLILGKENAFKFGLEFG